jgi:cyclophilin family peptidyl-prolyl cis-trans isomerase/HEAT repeat protein
VARTIPAMWRRPLLAASIALLLGGGCTPSPPVGAPSASGPPAAATAALEGLDQRALLLLLTHRGIFEPFTVEQALEGGVALRRVLAITLGRLPDARVGAPLRFLAQDADLETRRAAVFSLGSSGDAALAGPALLRAVADPDREVGALAVAGLGRLEVPLAEVLAVLATLPESERWARLLPALFRFREEDTVAVARRALGVADAGLRAHAAHALSRHPRPEAAPLLRPLLADPDPVVRGWAARALGQVGEAADLAALAALLDDHHSGPVIQALRSGAALLADGRAAATDTWRARLRTLVDDPRAGVRVTALEVAGHWLWDELLGEALVARARDGHVRERELALLALAQGRHPQAADLAAQLARSPEPMLRAAAASAWGLLGRLEPVRTLRVDEAPRVRLAAFHVLQAAADLESGPVLALEALAEEDPVLRASALEWLTEHPRLGLAPLLESLGRSWQDPIDEARLAAVRALVARAEVERLERGRILSALEELTAHPDYLLRREVAAGLVRLGRPPPPLGAAHPGYPMAAYRDLVLRTAVPREMEMVTSRGTVILLLDCPRAPLACVSFLQLANQGFYDGTTFHRVVPDFVVQGGDPRGDGRGGPGYTLRDEPSPVPFERGVLGMASSGPDTAGSQFFVTLAAQPHLDGHYTYLGRVRSGMEVLDGILQGDQVLLLRERP